LRVEVGAGIQVEVFVGGPGETVPAGVRAAPVAVDGVLERQHRGCWDLVQRRLAQHLVEGDSLELRRAHAADEADPVQSGQCAVIGGDGLVIPAHTLFERMFARLSMRRSVL
jgi:hypothetical protein